ncbi:MAG: hypothetical protein ABIC04_02900 [Nanoarchaeota archaeon]
MNKNDKQFLKVLAKIIELGNYKYLDIPNNLLDYIKQKYINRNESIFCKYSKGKKSNINGESVIFLLEDDKLILKKESVSKEKQFEIDGGYSGYLTLDDYKDESKFIIGLGNYGYNIYDKLENQELNELTQQTISEQIKISKKQTLFIAISVLIAVISLIFAIVVGWNDIQLTNKQHILIDNQLNSISPLKPTIQVSVDFPDNYQFPVWKVAKINNYQDGSQNFARQKIMFILSNIGRMRAGHINIFLKSEFFNLPSKSTENIFGESSEFIEFEIWNDKCEIDLEEVTLKNGSKVKTSVVEGECDYEEFKFPLGWHAFNLTLDCPLCAEKNKVYFFDFCIYNNDNESIKVCSIRS